MSINLCNEVLFYLKKGDKKQKYLEKTIEI